MSDRNLGTPIFRIGTVTSTMDIARRLEQLGASEGITIVATKQTQGRGRSDRNWQSPPNTGLYCSVLLRPKISMSQFQPFSVAVGLAICEALDPEAHLGLQLKWPNDILWQGRKLAGILITTTLQGPNVTSAIVGIGLNLRLDPSRPEIAISLQEIPDIPGQPFQDPEQHILSSLSARYAQLIDGKTSPIADWKSRLAFLGQHVSLRDGRSELSGVVSALDPHGALVLQTAAGERIIKSGELSRGPRLT